MARRELDEINDWLAQFDPDLPSTLTERLDDALNKLLDFPQIGSPVPDSDFRKLSVRRTPYLILYRQTREGVRVLKVRHARSNRSVTG